MDVSGRKLPEVRVDNINKAKENYQQEALIQARTL